MKSVNLYNEAAVMAASKKEVKQAKAIAAKGVRDNLKEFAPALGAALERAMKGTDKAGRDAAATAKGLFAAKGSDKIAAAAAVVAACYPYQTTAGELLAKGKDKQTGARVWVVKKLTPAAADSIIRESLKNFIYTCGRPAVEVHAAGEQVAAE